MTEISNYQNKKNVECECSNSEGGARHHGKRQKEPQRYNKEEQGNRQGNQVNGSDRGIREIFHLPLRSWSVTMLCGAIHAVAMPWLGPTFATAYLLLSVVLSPLGAQLKWRLSDHAVLCAIPRHRLLVTTVAAVLFGAAILTGRLSHPYPTPAEFLASPWLTVPVALSVASALQCGLADFLALEAIPHRCWFDAIERLADRLPGPLGRRLHRANEAARRRATEGNTTTTGGMG